MGRNGAGKTTTMKAIMGLMAQSTGKIRFDGHDISGRQPYEIARLGLGFTPEDRRIFSDLTVLENLDIGRQPPRKFSDGVPAPVWTEEKLLALFPNLGRNAEPSGRPDERRRAADAHRGADADGQSAADPAGRAVRGRAPLIVELMANTILELEKGWRCRSCCRSRTCISPNWSRTGPMSSKRARSNGMAPWPSLRRILTFNGLI